MTASDQTRNSPCGNQFAKQFVTSIAQHHMFKARYTSSRVTHSVREFCCLRKSRDVCACALCLCVSVQMRVCLLSASESRCASVSACQSRSACFFCLLVSTAVCVVCWLRARHHVRVLCLSVHHDLNVFGGKGKEIRASVLVILREHKCQPIE